MADLAFNCKEKIKSELQLFPHHFQLDLRGSDSLKRKSLERLRKRLEEEEVPNFGIYKSCAKCRDKNTLSYILFKLGKVEEAMKCIDCVLEEEPENIAALANKVAMFLSQERFTEAQVILDELKSLQCKNAEHFTRAKTEAQAELAYAYSRLGMLQYDNAIRLYKEAISTVPNQLLWKYELSKIMIRKMDNFATDESTDIDEIFEESKVLLDDVRSSLGQKDIDVLKGRALVAIGDMHKKYRYWRETKRASEANFKEERSVPESDDYIKQSFEEGVSFAPNDRCVLETYGNYLRISGQIETGEEYLRKAISIHPTSRACHHLGLLLERKWKLSAKRRPNEIHLSDIGQALNDVSGKRLAPEQYRINYNEYGSQYSAGRYYRQCLIFMEEPNNPVLMEAVKYLQQAVDVSNGENHKAMSSLGIILMRLREFEKAVSVFSKIPQIETNQLNVVVTSYENRGVCLYSMSLMDCYSEKDRETFSRDSKKMLMMAIEESAKMVTMKTPPISYPFLYEMLQNEYQSKKNHEKTPGKELARLWELLKKYKDAIAVLQDIQECDPNDPDAIIAIARNRRELNEYEEAVTCLELFKCDKDLHQHFPGELYVDCCLKAGSKFLNTGNHGICRKYYRSVYDHSFQNRRNFSYDVMVLSSSDEDDCGNPMLAGALVDCCGLKTWTFDEIAFGEPILESFAKAVDECCNFAIVFQSGVPNKYFDFCIQQVIHSVAERKAGECKIIVLDTRVDSGAVPTVLRQYPLIVHLGEESACKDAPSIDRWQNQLIEKLMTEFSKH